MVRKNTFCILTKQIFWLTRKGTIAKSNTDNSVLGSAIGSNIVELFQSAVDKNQTHYVWFIKSPMRLFLKAQKYCAPRNRCHFRFENPFIYFKTTILTCRQFFQERCQIASKLIHSVKRFEKIWGVTPEVEGPSKYRKWTTSGWRR